MKTSQKSIKNCERFILTYVYNRKLSRPFYKLYLFHMQISSGQD